MIKLSFQTELSIEGLDEADVLIILFNNAKPQGLDVLSIGDAKRFLEKTKVREGDHGMLEYCLGRVIRVKFGSTKIDLRNYLAQNGSDRTKIAIRQIGLLTNMQD